MTAENKLDCRNAEKRSSSTTCWGIETTETRCFLSDPPGPGLSASLIASTVAASASEAALEAAKQLRHLLPECERAGHKLGCVLDLGHWALCLSRCLVWDYFSPQNGNQPYHPRKIALTLVLKIL